MEETELSDYANIHEFGGLKQTETNSSNTKQPERRLLRIGLLTLGVLCILQVTLNIALRLAFYSKEETDQFPFNSSVIEEVCQIDQSPQISTQFSFCCNKLLGRLLRENKALKTERDRLQGMISKQSKDKENPFIVDGSESGSGSLWF